jgi:hypothetical protein
MKETASISTVMNTLRVVGFDARCARRRSGRTTKAKVYAPFMAERFD